MPDNIWFWVHKKIVAIQLALNALVDGWLKGDTEIFHINDLPFFMWPMVPLPVTAAFSAPRAT